MRGPLFSLRIDQQSLRGGIVERDENFSHSLTVALNDAGLMRSEVIGSEIYDALATSAQISSSAIRQSFYDYTTRQMLQGVMRVH